jgi:phosphoribosylformylglycinamidine cyclo-ligase
MTDASLYARLGASATKDDIHRAVAGVDAGLFPDAFCRLGPDTLGGDPAWCAALHADGAGTKAIVAYLAFRETGDPAAFAGLAQDAAVMNLDDLLCVGAVERFALVNTIGRNAKLVPGAAVQALVEGYARFCERMAEQGIAIAFTGGETADLGDAVRTLVVDAAIATRLPRSAVIDPSRIVPGDVIVGLSATGQASYEDSPNSGVAANGLTLYRHVLLRHEYAERYPETLAPETDRQLAYRGPYRLEDTPAGLGMSVGAALLSPTRTYAPIIRKLLAELPGAIHALIHNTGGGLGKCLRFGRGIHFVKDNLFPLPPLQRLTAELAKLGPAELARTFHGGHRMEIYLPAALADRACAIARAFQVDARVVGHCAASPDGANRVTVQAPWGAAELR